MSAGRVYVRGQVLGQVVGPRKAFPTHVTVVGPFARVYPEMAREVALAPEGSAAEQTDERTLAGVLAHVQLEVLFGTDALSAERAGKSSLALSLYRVGSQQVQ